MFPRRVLLRALLFTLVFTFLFVKGAPAWAIPPNTPITNTATATFDVGGFSYTSTASDTVITDASSVFVIGVVLGGDDVANPEFSVSVGTCAATETAFVVYFVTINQ